MSHGPYVVENVAVDIKVDEVGLSRTMILYVQALGANFEKFFKRQARLLCQDMLDYTVPYTEGPRAGRNAMARQQGIQSMERDIDRIFAPLGIASYGDIARVGSYGIFCAWLVDRKESGYPVPKGFEDGFGGTGEWQAFQDRFKDEDSFFHEDQAPDYSTVYGGESIATAHIATRGGTRTPNYKKGMQASGNVFLVSGHASKIAAYKKRVANRVGTLKAGWYSAGMAIGDGTISAPQWIVGNQWGSGLMINQLNERPTLSITIGNMGHDLMTGEPGFSRWNDALSHRAYSIRNELARRLSNRNGETVEQATEALLATGHFEITSADNIPF